MSKEASTYMGPNSNARAAYGLSLLAVLGLFAVFMFQGLYPRAIGPFTNLSTPVFAFAATLSAGLAMKRYGANVTTRSGRVWVPFTAGILLWFAGEVTWSTYSLLLNVPIPYPSVADVFYLTGYIMFFVGFVVYIEYFRSAFSGRIILLVAVGISASAAFVSFLLLGPVLTLAEDPLTWFFDFVYPLSDLLLLSVALLGLTLLVRGRLGTSWLFLTVGILLNVFADMLFSYTTARGTYYNGSLPDLLYLLGYVSFALAFYVHRKEL